MPRTTGRGGSGNSGGGIGSGRGGGFGSARGPSGPGITPNYPPRTAAEWFERIASGRPNPFRAGTVGDMKYSLHRELFRHARQGRDTDIGRWSRNVFRRIGMTVDNEGARFAGRFTPHRPPARLGESEPPRTADPAPTRPTPLGLAPRTPPKPEPLPLARRGEPLRALELRGGRPGGRDETLAGGAGEDRLTGGAGNDKPDTAPPANAPADAKPSAPVAVPTDITAPGAPLDRNGPAYRHISEKEGGQLLKGYNPEEGVPGADSGVTVGTGVDLGQRSAEDIGKLEIPPELAEKLVPYAGHRGKAADEFLAKNPLTLTTAEAEALDAAVWQDIVGKVEHRYNRETEKNGSGVKFEKLPDEVLSSIVNIAYVSGDNLESKTPKFWSHVTTQDWRAAAAELKDFGFESEGNNERAKDAGERLSVYLDSPGGGRPRR